MSIWIDSNGQRRLVCTGELVTDVIDRLNKESYMSSNTVTKVPVRTGKVLSIEGPHRVGKDSLEAEFHTQTSYQHIVYVRGPISNWAFSILKARPELDLEEMLTQWFNNKLAVIVHVTLPNQQYKMAQVGRMFYERHGETGYQNEYLAQLIQTGIDMAKRIAPDRVYEVESHKDTIYLMANDLKKWIDKLPN